MQRVRMMLGATAVIAAATACGTTRASPPLPTAATTTTAATAAPPVTVTTTAAAPTTTATTATTAIPSATVGVSRCHTSQLTASMRGVDGGASNAGIEIVLSNRGSVTCTLYGYPGIGLLDGGKVLDKTTVPRSGSYLFHDPGAHTVTLAPGATASAGFGFLDGEGYGPKVVCSPVAYLQVTPPDETAALTLPFDAHDTGDQLCGVEGITALATGTSAGESS